MNITEVVVGSCFDSLMKSHKEKIKIVLTTFEAPHFFDSLKKPVLIEGQRFSSLREAWSFLKFLNCMEGLVVNPTEPFAVRIQKNTVAFGRHEIQFEKCHLFPDSKLKTDLEVKKIVNEDYYRVLDIMKLPFCSVEDMKTMNIPNSFVNQVKFFGKKDIVSASYLNFKQINDFNYSDTMAKFYVEKELLHQKDLKRPLISPSRGPRKPKPIVTERIVQPLKKVLYKSTRRVKQHDSKNNFNSFKARGRNSTSIRD